MINKMNTIAVVVIVLIIFPLIEAQADGRQYQHGIDFVPSGNGKYWLLWSSSRGNPPEGKQTVLLPDNSTCAYFNHDIFYSHIDVQNVQVAAKRLIALPEAQEPVSAAISAKDRILITMEDGSDSDLSINCEGRIQQRFQVFDSNLQPLSDIKTVTSHGAHSGHATAVGDRFVIVYSQGWIKGGGVDNQGSGKDIELNVVDGHGAVLHHKKINIDISDSRDWWPLVAASSRYVIIVWQRYVANIQRANLMFAVYDPLLNKITKKTTLLQSDVYYYHYDIQYLPGINRFIIVGNYLGDLLVPVEERRIFAKTQKGFVFLLDENGNIVHRWEASHKCEICNSYHTHPFVREAQAAIYSGDGQAKVLYPVKPKGALLFYVSASEILLQKYIKDDHYWQSLGTDGIFMDAKTVLFATLSRQGLRTRILSVEQ